MNFLERMFKKEKVDESLLDPTKVPTHLAIIMDGNGRWAKRRKLPKIAGHKEGAKVLKKIVRYCDEIGIKYLTVYAFSTENWKRPKDEVDGLMALMLDYLKNAEREIGGENVRIRVIGNTKELSQELQKEIIRVDKATQNNSSICLNLAVNYGGRNEIISACKEIAKDVKDRAINVDDINEEVFGSKLYTLGIPEPDLIIRTSGEKRISNFLLWQCAYSEFWYTDALWPDFRKEHVFEAVLEYQKRNRRYGGV